MNTEPFLPRPFDLTLQPTRPGVAYESLRIQPSPALTASICGQAASEGLAVAPWAGLAVESERALRYTCELTAADPDDLVGVLHAAALAPVCDRLPVGSGGRLAAYARALRRAKPFTEASESACLTLPVPYLSLTAWHRAAGADGMNLSDWAIAQLERRPVARPLWEAAAAEAGQTVSEWVLAQAASR